MSWISIYLKRLKIGSQEGAALAIIVSAITLRLFLIAQGVPQTNSDEGTMGLEAMHIAFRGEHPIFLYGQDYMGVLEAYIAAPFFHLFGVSVFSLRLGMVIMFALFLVSMYLLASLLYTKKLALITLLLLSFGLETDVIVQQLRAVGGAIETLLFGSIVLLLASWLALTSRQAPLKDGRKRRWLAYVGCGLAAGLGLWVHVLVAPFVLLSGLLLIVFCHRELRTWVGMFLLLGLLVGAFPLIYFNITAAPGHNSLSTILAIHSSASLAKADSQNLLAKQFLGTILWSLPLATGLTPICSVNDLPYYGPPTSSTVPCILIHGGWSLGYIALLTIAIALSLRVLWELWHLHQFRANPWSLEERQAAIISFARLMILISAALTILLYVSSPLSGLKPWSTRYLVGLLIAIPSVLWPLWNSASFVSNRLPSIGFIKFMGALKRAILVLISIVILAGTFVTLATIPGAQAANQQQEALVSDLLHIHVTHIYAGYWTCYRLMFQSQEQIICAVPPGLQEPGTNRYIQYYAMVKADPHAAYAFSEGSPDALAFAKKVALSNVHYRKFIFDGYVVYQPEIT